MKTLLFALSAVALYLYANFAFTNELTPVRGETEAEKKGFEIAALSDRSDRGFGDSEVEVTMVLKNAAGQESTRKMRFTTLEVQDEAIGDKTMVLFSTPKDVEGTALLSHAKMIKPDDQWLYLPALKRVKRISSKNKSGPFVGSEFAYEDFTSTELNKYDYTWLHSEACGGMQCEVVERIPLYQHSGYSRQVSWIDIKDFQLRKVEFYDRRNTLLKTLDLLNYKKYGDVWRFHKLVMTNHKTGKSTDLIFDTYRFKVGLKDSDFVKGKLTSLR